MTADQRTARSIADLNRRQFLSAGATLALSAAVPAVASAAPVRKRTGWVTVFRLSTHGHRTCGACKANAANKFFRTHAAADQGRAHRGCNCAILTQRLPPGVAKNLFGSADVFDRRRGA